MGYAATGTPAAKYFLPNVTKTLGGSAGWTTPILLQSVTATGASLTWYRFSDGSLAYTQTLSLAAGTGVRIDPRSIAQLTGDTQYAVVAEGTGGTIDAIVTELAGGCRPHWCAFLYRSSPQFSILRACISVSLPACRWTRTAIVRASSIQSSTRCFPSSPPSLWRAPRLSARRLRRSGELGRCGDSTIPRRGPWPLGIRHGSSMASAPS